MGPGRKNQGRQAQYKGGAIADQGARLLKWVGGKGGPLKRWRVVVKNSMVKAGEKNRGICFLLSLFLVYLSTKMAAYGQEK